MGSYLPIKAAISPGPPKPPKLPPCIFASRIPKPPSSIQNLGTKWKSRPIGVAAKWISRRAGVPFYAKQTQSPKPQTSQHLVPQRFTPISPSTNREKTNPIKPNSPHPNTRTNRGKAEILSEVPIYRGCTSGPNSNPTCRGVPTTEIEAKPRSEQGPGTPGMHIGAGSPPPGAVQRYRSFSCPVINSKASSTSSRILKSPKSPGRITPYSCKARKCDYRQPSTTRKIQLCYEFHAFSTAPRAR